jgi:DNA-binding beta-propeller fold protein YncE
VNRTTRQFLTPDQTTTPGPRRTRGATGALIAATLVSVLLIAAASGPAYGATIQPAQSLASRMTTVVSANVVPGALEYPVTATIATGNSYFGIASNPVTNRIYAISNDADYVINKNARSVTVIDGSTDAIMTVIGLGVYAPQAVAVNSITNRVLVLAIDGTGSFNTVLLVIDGSTNTVVGSPLVVNTSAGDFAIDTSTNTAFVANNDGTVTVVDTATMTIIGTPIVVGGHPAQVGVDSTNHTVYVVDDWNETVSVINGTTRTVVGTPIVAGVPGVYSGWDPLPVGIAVDESLHRAFIVVFSTNEVTVIDGATRSIVGAPIPVGVAANAVAVDSSTHTVYVSHYGGTVTPSAGSVSVIDGSTNTIVGTPTAVGVSADVLSVNSATHKVYVTNYGSAAANSGSVSVITPTVPTAFADVTDPNNAFFSYIQWMFTSGISTGTPQPSGKPLYNPANAVSRQAMASFLFKLSGETFVPPSVSTFADVDPSATFFTAIEWMASKEISTGTPQASGKPLFKPADAVSRQAMALFLARYAHTNLTVAPTVQSFADVPVDAPVAVAAAVKWMKDTGISTGTVQPTGLPLYKPADPVSRMAMAAFLYRLAHLPV